MTHNFDPLAAEPPEPAESVDPLSQSAARAYELFESMSQDDLRRNRKKLLALEPTNPDGSPNYKRQLALLFCGAFLED